MAAHTFRSPTSFNSTLSARGLAAFALVALGAAACSSAGAPETNADLGVAEAAASSDACWDGTVFPRPAKDPIASTRVVDAYASFRADVVRYEAAQRDFQVAYEAALAAQNEALESHPDYATYKAEYPVYSAALQTVSGRACAADSECDTGSTKFPGRCRIYYEHGQCIVDGAPTLPVIPLNLGVTAPVAPAQPLFTCADFTCAANFQCELEENTGGIACVLNRCGGGRDRGDTGGGNGGGGRRGGGR